MRQIPNLLTITRLLLAPIFLLLMLNPVEWQRWAATAIFIFAALTDLIDGILARRFAAESDLGKLLDPLADKIIVMAALVMLVELRDEYYGDPWVPAWMVVLILAREMWVTGLRGVAANKGSILAASLTGKVKNFIQVVSIVCLLLHDVRLPLPEVINTSGKFGCNLLLVSLIVSYWSALEYSLLVLGGNSWVPGLRVPRSDRGTQAGE